jgi:hypothetical protein
MKGRAAFVLAIAVVLLAQAVSGYEARTDSFVVMTSARSDSSIVLEIEDGGYAYERVEGLVGASKPANYSISVNGNEVRAGVLDPSEKMFAEYRLSLAPGNSTIDIRIGADSYHYSLRVINRSYEDQVRDGGNYTGPQPDYFFKDLMKVFAATFTGIVASFVCVFIWLKDKLSQDVRVML